MSLKFGQVVDDLCLNMDNDPELKEAMAYMEQLAQEFNCSIYDVVYKVLKVGPSKFTIK